MARTVLTVIEASRVNAPDPVQLMVPVDAANGNSFWNCGRCAVGIRNNGAGTVVATFLVPRTVHGLAIADLEVSVLGGGDFIWIGPFPKRTFNQPDGYTYIDWSSGASISVGVYRIPPT